MWDERGLTACLEEIIARWEIPGLAVGIVSANEVLYSRAFGVQSLAAPRPVTADTLFCTASMTKTFVAVLVMQLVEEGLLSLDEPLTRRLPYFYLGDERSTRVTIRQVLSHTSGIPDMDEDEYDFLVSHPEWDEGAAERYVRGLRGRQMAADPGARFLYSNIAYNILGDLVAKTLGAPFETVLRERVLLPAGMPDSTLLFAGVDRARLAVPHIRVPELAVAPYYPYHRADAPASFLHASLSDMCAWLMTCLNGGGAVLPAHRLEEMFMPVAPWGFPPLYEHIGLGWTLGHYNGARTASHGGMGFGWTDFMTVLPERDRAVVLLCSEESFARGRTVRALLDAALGLQPQPGTVSWKVPVLRALCAGGIDAARDCARGLLAEREEYEFDEADLINLVYQLRMAGKDELAAAVLEINLLAFPDSAETADLLARLRPHG